MRIERYEADEQALRLILRSALFRGDIQCFVPDVPPALSSLVMQLLAKDKNERVQTATGLAGQLEGLLYLMPILDQMRL